LDLRREQHEVDDLGNPRPRQPEHPRRAREVVEFTSANTSFDLVGERKQPGHTGRSTGGGLLGVALRATRPLEGYGQRGGRRDEPRLLVTENANLNSLVAPSSMRSIGR
jgi:hypothetical protein